MARFHGRPAVTDTRTASIKEENRTRRAASCLDGDTLPVVA